MKKFKPLQVIEVTWWDSSSDDDWLYITLDKKDHGLGKCQTVGYFIRWTDRSLQIAPTISKEEPRGFAGMWSIPRSCVVKVVKR